MRERLVPYSGNNRLNYLCILASELLGVMSLCDIPMLLSGFHSITRTLHPDVAQAIQTLRLTGWAPVTLRELRLAVDAYNNHHRILAKLGEAAKKEGEEDEGEEDDGTSQRYEIDKNFDIKRLWSVRPEDVTQAIAALTSSPPIKVTTPPDPHDSTLPAMIRRKNHDYRGDITKLEFKPPPIPAYDQSRIAQPPGKILWSELIAVADAFDAADVRDGRQQAGQRTWFRRLHDEAEEPTAELLAAQPSGLVPTDGIDLTGIKHLIGLPGAGKTTLLFLIAALLAWRDLKVCFLFPSIEVSINFIETLGRHGVSAALLSGQGDSARTRHIQNFSSSVARQNQGFGVSKPSSRFFATNCALGGFASEEDEDFPHDDPPCLDIQQRLVAGAKPRRHRCALASVCARQNSERELIHANIWAGHILSIDRKVAPLFSGAEIKHFEFIARTFDLIVVDECDGAQADLDDRGTPTMHLFGEQHALWATLIGELHAPIARGKNAVVAHKDMPSLIEMTARFGQAANRLSARIQHTAKHIQDAYQSKLLTSLSIIADMYPYEGDQHDEDEREAHANARHGIEELWDACIKLVAFRPSIKDDDEEIIDLEKKIPEIAAMLSLPETQIKALQEQLYSDIMSWDLDADLKSIARIAATLRSITTITSPLNELDFHDSCGLLTTVSMVVLQHFGLAPHLRLLNSMGLVGDDVFESRPSRDQLAILPESLTGKLSGIRFTLNSDGDINISHIGVQGTPRRLFQRIQDLGKEMGGEGPAVLLTSATSLLEQSPSFHINEGPHYVLRRPNAGAGWGLSRYAFLPLPDPAQPGKMLRFSGANFSSRDRILKNIVDRLLEGDRLSHVHQALINNDVVDGIGRKAGLIVNSYEQAETLYLHIQSMFPEWKGRVRYLRRSAGNAPSAHSVTASDVESLGSDQGWDILIFAMSAIGRGVNIVYRQGPRMNQAMIGSLFFLTRPHPRQDDLGLIQGLIGRRSEEFDKRHFASQDDALQALRTERKVAMDEAKAMLRIPLMAARLGKYVEPFVADQMIIILQTIGRAMRGDCPAFVHFVDSAWAPQSALGKPDTEKTSMLVMMQKILSDCLSHPDPLMRDCYANLYTSFGIPMSSIQNLIKV